mgnify:CR=1 FL=1
MGDACSIWLVGQVVARSAWRAALAELYNGVDKC